MKFCCGTSWYTTTDEFPEDYLVWNIGEYHAPAGMIPLCKLKETQGFEDGRAIETDSLLALPVSDEVRQIVMKRAGRREIDRKAYYNLVKRIKRSQTK